MEEKVGSSQHRSLEVSPLEGLSYWRITYYSSTSVVRTGQRPQHSVWDFQIQRCLRNKEENASSTGATHASGLSFLDEVPKLHCGQQLATEAIACCLLMSSQTLGGEMCFCLEQKKKMGHGE